MKSWQKIIRNFFVVLVLLLANDLIRTQSFSFDSFPYSLGIALLWACYEFVRLYKIDITGITKKRNALTLLLP